MKVDNKGIQGSEITSLYGIRGLAAIWIVAFHYSLYLTITKGINLGYAKSFIGHGFFGVELFFILSGFVLSYRYLSPFKKLRLTDYGHFLKNRIARIYPTYIFALTVVFIFFLAGALTDFALKFGDFSYQYLFLNAVMMQAWTFLGFSKWSWNFPGWSVSVEWFLYLTCPIIFYLINKNQGKVIRISILLSAYFLLSYLASTHAQFFNLESEKYGLIRGIAEFFIGTVFFTFVKNIEPHKIYDVFALICILGLVIGLFIGINSALILIPLCLFIPFVTLSNNFIKKFLSLKPLWYLGEISYSLYIMQFPFQLISNNIFSHVSFNLNNPEIILLYLSQILLLIGLSSIVHFTVEKPFREKIRKLNFNAAFSKPVYPTENS